MDSLANTNGFHEGLAEVESVFEIFQGVAVALSENLLIDEIEHDLAHVLAFVDPPVGKDGHHHRAEFLERVLADAIQEFLAADVP